MSVYMRVCMYESGVKNSDRYNTRMPRLINLKFHMFTLSLIANVRSELHEKIFSCVFRRHY